jgi:hypothetical protein
VRRISMPNPYEYLNYLIINTQDDSLGIIRIPYVVFNGFESVCWICCAIYISRRCLKNSGGREELYYALAYFSFALGEMIEMCGVTVLLLLFKGASLWPSSVSGNRSGSNIKTRIFKNSKHVRSLV